MADERYMECPLWRAYQETQLKYLRETERREWLDRERRQMWMVICAAIPEQSAEVKKRVFLYFCRRLNGHVKTKWIPFIAGMNDETAYGRNQNEKMKNICIRIRNAARTIMSEIEKERIDAW